MDFVIIANAWNDGRHNPTSKHRIAIELVHRGHRVFWIDGSGMRTPSIGSSHDRLRIVKKVRAAFSGVRREAIDAEKSIWVVSPLLIPLPKYEFIRRLNGMICRLLIRYWGRRLGFQDPVLINYIPVLAEAMRGVSRPAHQLLSCQVDELPSAERVAGCQVDELLSEKNFGQSLTTQELNNPTTTPRAPRVVYHCVDRWDAFSNYDSAMMAEMDKRCCQNADLVIASSRDLVERCRRYSKNVHLVSHGVDHDHFSKALQVTQRPADLPPGRIAGFFGLLSEWLDQDMLIEVARRVPECEIVLIGKADVAIERLKGAQNIHLLGSRPFSQLPAYIASFDVGLIPFVVNELTLAVNPIKLREMLAAGCPVISTDLPEVHAYLGRGVVVAKTVELFCAALAERLRQPATQAERAAISGSVANETWSAKVDEMLDHIAAIK